MTGRHRVIGELRGDNADSWLRQLTYHDTLKAFMHRTVVERGEFYHAAPKARPTIMIPRASQTHDFVLDRRRYALTFCHQPKFFLLEELRD